MSSEPPPAEPTEAAEAARPSASPPKESEPAGAGGAAAAAPGAAHETNALWVGNLPAHAGEDDVMAAFAPHEALDCVVTRTGSRSYAFVLFRSVAESRAALEALRGSKVKGAFIRVEFARPARAVRNLWVGGISPSISKQEVEEEFRKFGKIEGVAFSHDQTSAYIDFEKLEDAISAHRALNGTDLGGKELCVDFQRSRGRAERAEAGNFNSRGSLPPGEMGVGHAKGSAGVRMREAKNPTNVLWVGLPNTHKVNEEALRRAMAAHGVVTNIKVFPERQYAFVEFATIEGASNAKNLLDGRLFNDTRIHVLFSSSGLAPSKLDNLTPPAGFPRSEMYNDSPYAAPDYFGAGRSSHGTSQGYDPRRGRSRYLDYGAMPITGGILPAPEAGSSLLTGHSAHNALDPREAKRVRLDAGMDPYHVRAGSEGRQPVADESLSSVIRIQGTVHQTSCLGHFWRGSIAKGGSPVCRARCLPIRRGIEIPLPDIVNISARTGLDMLAKHYGDASGFEIVFFLPDSEDDFVSYTEFLRYLGSKSRAGVVKVDAGTTLFLVPPSDFLTNVLQVDGPERLYGVVLHIPQMSNAAVQRPVLTGPESQAYYDGGDNMLAMQRNYNMGSANDNHHQDADYRGSFREEAVQSGVSSFPMSQIAGQQGQSLKPDIMATLAKLMPNVQSTVPANSQVGLQQSGQQFGRQAPVSYGGMVGAQEQHPTHTAYNPEVTLSLPPPPPLPTQGPVSALPTQQQYQPEHYYAPQNNYGSLGTVSQSNFQSSNTNLPVPPPHQMNGGLAANNQMGNLAQLHQSTPFPTDRVNLDFSSQVQQQQNVASGSAQAPEEADKNKKYQATLQFAHNLLLQLQRGSGNQS